ncbi:unnamed protein product [Ixodes pacificus]
MCEECFAVKAVGLHVRSREGRPDGRACQTQLTLFFAVLRSPKLTPFPRRPFSSRAAGEGKVSYAGEKGNPVRPTRAAFGRGLGPLHHSPTRECANVLQSTIKN